MRLYAASTLASLIIGVAFTFTAEPAGNVTPLPTPKSEPWIEQKCDVGVPLVLSAGEAKQVAWRLIDEGTGGTLTTVPGSTSAVFHAAKSGRYRYAVIADGKAEWYALVAGDVPPPLPVPPQPVDELVAKLQAAFKADASETKAADLANLRAIYLQAVDEPMRQKAGPDGQPLQAYAYDTAADLYAAVRLVANKLLPDGRLAGLRQILAADLVLVLPVEVDAPLTDGTRKQASAAFARYAKALAAVAAP